MPLQLLCLVAISFYTIQISIEHQSKQSIPVLVGGFHKRYEFSYNKMGNFSHFYTNIFQAMQLQWEMKLFAECTNGKI